MSVHVKTYVPASQVRELDELIARGRFTNRSDAMRQAIKLMLEQEDDRIGSESSAMTQGVKKPRATESS